MSPFNACKVFCEYSWPDCGKEFDKFVKKTEYITTIDRKYWNRHGLVGPLHSILGMKLMTVFMTVFNEFSPLCVCFRASLVFCATREGCECYVFWLKTHAGH